MGRKNSKFGVTSEVTKADGAKLAEEKLAQIGKIEAEFEDIQNYRRKQSNNLLGVFVGEKYVIPDAMKARLIEIPKRFDRFEGESLYASAILGSFVLNFRVDLDVAPDFCSAKLHFIEVESGVFEDSKHVSLLDDVLEIYDPQFRSKMDERWNIYYGSQSPKHDDFLERYMRAQLEEEFFTRELVDVLSQLYVKRVLTYVSTKMGEEGEKIEQEFKKLATERAEKDPDFGNKHEEQKKVLDEVLRQHNAFKEIVKSEEGQKIMQAFSKPLKNVRDKAYPSILIEEISPKKMEERAKTEPEKTEEKTAVPSKPKAAAPNSGAKKSAPKKKSKPFVPPKIKVSPTNLGKPGTWFSPISFAPSAPPKQKAEPEIPKVVSPPIEGLQPTPIAPVAQPAPTNAPPPAPNAAANDNLASEVVALGTPDLAGIFAVAGTEAVKNVSENAKPQKKNVIDEHSETKNLANEFSNNHEMNR